MYEAIEEYAQLETAAQTSGRTLGEWCREVVLASDSDAERHDPALAEIVGVRLLLVNVLRPLAAGGECGDRRGWHRYFPPEDGRGRPSLHSRAGRRSQRLKPRFFVERLDWHE